MGRFKAYLGVTQIEVGNEKLELDIRLWDKAQISELRKISDGVVRMQKLSEILEKIIQRSYLKPYHFKVDEHGKILEDKPYEESEFQNPEEWQTYKKEMKEIRSFTEKKLDTMLFELGVEWGWFDREKMEKSFREGGEPEQRGKEEEVLRKTQEE